jgi:hypothetical protein
VIPPPHRNNLKPVDSPLRRPCPPTDDEISELEDFVDDPSTKTINKNRKKSKTVNFITNNNDKNVVHSPVEPPSSNHSNTPQQGLATATPTAAMNQQTNANSSSTITLTDEAKRFAQTRYPFPPFIIRLPSSNIQEQKVVEDLRNFVKEKHQLELELIGFRKSTIKCLSSEFDILLFVKNSQSFAILYEEVNWS